MADSAPIKIYPNIKHGVMKVPKHMVMTVTISILLAVGQEKKEESNVIKFLTNHSLLSNSPNDFMFAS